MSKRSKKNPERTEMRRGESMTIDVPGAKPTGRQDTVVGGVRTSVLTYSDGTVVTLRFEGKELKVDCNREYEVDEATKTMRVLPTVASAGTSAAHRGTHAGPDETHGGGETLAELFDRKRAELYAQLQSAIDGGAPPAGLAILVAIDNDHIEVGVVTRGDLARRMGAMLAQNNAPRAYREKLEQVKRPAPTGKIWVVGLKVADASAEFDVKTVPIRILQKLDLN